MFLDEGGVAGNCRRVVQNGAAPFFVIFEKVAR